MEELKKAALKYSERFKVFPLIPGKKVPIFDGGFHIATQDKEQIEKWWNQIPQANIGLVTEEESDVFVFDIDRKNGKDGLRSISNVADSTVNFQDGKTLYDKIKEYDSLVGYTTASNGQHLYFRSDDEVTKKRIGELWEGIDIMGANGYVIPPPSVVDGKPYKGIESFDIANIPEAPQWLIEAISKRVKTKETGANPMLKVRSGNFRNVKYTARLLMEFMNGVAEGNRDNWLTQQCGRMLALGVNPEYTYEWLNLLNEKFVEPSLPMKDVDRIFKSVLKKEVRKR